MSGTFAVALAACGGGGSTGGSAVPVVASAAPVQPASGSTATVQFTIAWPAVASSSQRTRSYISPSTKSITIAGTGFATAEFDNPTLNTAATPAPTYTETITAPVGNDTFTVTAYSAVHGAGSVLSSDTVVFDVLIDTANVVPLTLIGNLASIVCMPVGPFVYDTVSGTNGAYTQVGPTGQIVLQPEDAANNIIVGPGLPPQLSLAATTASQATVTTFNGTQNEFNVSPSAIGANVPLTASGTDRNGATVTNTACSDTRLEALYVTNRGASATNPGGAGTQSVTIYPATASGNATPIATLVGASTQQAAIQFPAVDAQGNLYVSNQGPLPGTAFNPYNSGYVSVYGPGSQQSGNQAPIAKIANLSQPTGITFDAANDLYITSYPGIAKYAPGLSGAMGAPTSFIGGALTDLNGSYGMFVDASGTIYSAGSDLVATFAKGASGNVAPTNLIEPPTTTAMSFGSYSWLSVAADASGNIYAPGFNNNVDTIDEYAATASGAMQPTPYGSNMFSQPAGIYIDSNGYFYVTNYGNNSVEVFDTSTALLSGVATATISGSNTGLSFPFGVYAR